MNKETIKEKMERFKKMEWIEEVKFCPLCGAKEDFLTGGTQYDSLFKRDRYDYYCNNCYKSFIILRIKEQDWKK